MSINQRGDVRIISGNKRGSKIHFSAHRGLRPSGDRVREMLFAWLQSDIVGSRCLDMYAGSGAIGFEAASRGASEVLLLENNRQAVEALQANSQRLKFDNVAVVAADATNIASYQQAPVSDAGFDVVFVDPPFEDDLHQHSIDLLLQLPILNKTASIYVESDKHLAALSVPDNWQLHRDKVAGQVRAQLYRVIAAD